MRTQAVFPTVVDVEQPAAGSFTKGLAQTIWSCVPLMGLLCALWNVDKPFWCWALPFALAVWSIQAQRKLRRPGAGECN